MALPPRRPMIARPPCGRHCEGPCCTSIHFPFFFFRLFSFSPSPSPSLPFLSSFLPPRDAVDAVAIRSGGGPSSKTWPEMAAAAAAVHLGAHHEVAAVDRPIAPSSGSKKLGQPVPLSNLRFGTNSGWPQPAHVNVPARFSCSSAQLPGRSVACSRSTMYCSGRQQPAPFLVGLRDREAFSVTSFSCQLSALQLPSS